MRLATVVLAAVVAFGWQSPAPATAFQAVPIGTTQAVSVVQVDPTAGDLWLQTANVIRRRTRDGTWAEPLLAPDQSWGSMYVVRPGLIYGTTSTGTHTMVRAYRDGVWSVVGELTACVRYDLSIAGAGRTIAAGCSYYTGLGFWRTDARADFTDVGEIALDLAMVGEDDALVLQSNGPRRHRRGGRVATKIGTDIDAGLLWADRRSIVTATTAGKFHHATWDAATGQASAWASRQADQPVHLNDLWGRAADDVYAVGRRGLILHFDGTAWRRLPSPTNEDLLAVTGDRDTTWIGGASGTLLRRGSL